MSILRFVAWGVLDIDAMPKLERRAQLRALQKELDTEGEGYFLHIGGAPPAQPHYTFYKKIDETTPKPIKKNALAEGRNLQETCMKFVRLIDPNCEKPDEAASL